MQDEWAAMSTVCALMEARVKNRSLRRLAMCQQILLCLVAFWLFVRWIGV